MSPHESGTVHMFYICSAFEYFFSNVLIEHLGLDNVVFVMNDPREDIEKRAAERFPTIHSSVGPWRRLLGKKASKLRFARRVFRELGLRGRRVALYSPVYMETCVEALRERMERECTEVEYFMIPDGAVLLRHAPRKPDNPKALIRFLRRRYRAEPADRRHKTGSYSSFLKKVYHYPAKRIFADPEKVEMIPVPVSSRPHNGEVLVIGGLQGITRDFVRTARSLAGASRVHYRMHPRNRSGEEFILEEGPEWTELATEGSLEEHLLEQPYRLVLGPYSTVLVFNHFFVTESNSCYVIDPANEDEDWRDAAEACGIPIVRTDAGAGAGAGALGRGR